MLRLTTMLKVWFLMAAAAALRQIYAAPAGLTEQTFDNSRRPLYLRLPPFYICLTPQSGSLSGPMSGPLSGRLPPLSGAVPDRLTWPWLGGVREPVGGGEQQQQQQQQQQQLLQQQSYNSSPEQPNTTVQVPHRGKREPGSSNLSINNPLQVLRRRVMLELVRRHMQQQQTRINANSEILHKLGKRTADRYVANERQSSADFIQVRYIR
ncbi:Diuretic hormone [Amphibalanus amphitrite]|uniref:Diuretic hormone n=1 Tax=Amphibalanus amphitrite TaxID=1232801 RepID=A0A6A4VMI4_AMPAM|nr:Diuretic hormone [Amphibalanus amphitrite]